jgi:hypothetical protein
MTVFGDLAAEQHRPCAWRGKLHWVEFTGPAGAQTGLCFFDLADDGKIAMITDFRPDAYELPASRTHLVERY